ncbi:MAG TPA: multidrug ABC transporter ATP-binding protein [Thermoplasmata archaeon]|jgi:ABC-2 type transport system ATP-binding protein|nr:MAG TPA: multidrug ABC transporter ATP-binding protein [Thermoplasmata archaeon]
MIICDGLTKTFGSITAIQDFSLTIPDGCIFGLLGPNGAGKTTTMRMLSCLIRPTAGAAQIDSLEIGKKEDAQKIRGMIGLLPEVPGLYETLGAYKNLDYFGQFYGVPKQQREESIRTTLTNLGLWDRRSEPVGGFSKGMKQKIAIARALIHDPKYIFLDEPTASLDPAASKTVREYILELKSRGDTILINTHNLSEAERICDTVALVKNKIVKVGSPKALARGLFARTVSFTLQKIPSTLMKDISCLEFVSQAQVKGNQLVLNVRNPEEDNPRVVSWLMKQGLQVQFVTEEEHSLEDVYLKLIEEGGQ